jgi:hypothetical protein
MEIIKEGEPGYKSYFLDGSNNSEKSKVEGWLKKKWGRFSASQIFHLMVQGKGGEVFSPGGLTYIESVAREAYTIFNTEETPESFHMKMGKVREPASFARLRQTLRCDVLEYHGGDNPVFDLYTEDSGVSPDCKAPMPDGTVSFGAELKNPTGKTHMFYLRNIKDQFDLKKISEEYYAQVQKTLLTYKCDHWLWTSNNEFFPPKDQMIIIEVKADKQYQQNMDIRLKMATKKKYEIIEELKAL